MRRYVKLLGIKKNDKVRNEMQCIVKDQVCEETLQRNLKHIYKGLVHTVVDGRYRVNVENDKDCTVQSRMCNPVVLDLGCGSYAKTKSFAEDKEG